MMKNLYMYISEPTVPVKPPSSNEDTTTTWRCPHKVYCMVSHLKIHKCIFTLLQNGSLDIYIEVQR